MNWVQRLVSRLLGLPKVDEGLTEFGYRCALSAPLTYTADEVIQLLRSIQSIERDGGIRLRAWSSNRWPVVFDEQDLRDVVHTKSWLPHLHQGDKGISFAYQKAEEQYNDT